MNISGVKRRESGYAESKLFWALASDPFVEGDYLGNLETLREDVEIQKPNGCKKIPNLTTAEYFKNRRQ